MPNNSNAFSYQAALTQQSNEFFATKLACETDCSDVYADIKEQTKNYILLDVRSREAFDKSHAITAVSMPHSEINSESFAMYDKDTLFVVYCWGPGCNGATKAGLKISALGFAVKEMIGGIHYWEDFERYPVNRRVTEIQK
ncbi:rhodanese-like domain-containing protein [Psychrobacter sp. APC 3426]|uniref:rhodanese-like domain-containing protein n=1 Tax=Psychrobacter sp. APC 3426 TaxID=3035177 RepID=UPI0025B2DD6C|nr:rhodanese-like domain-containing protein [Psychrobacter sp. APC 3426]MDN3399413.1 rhodanese-like domain-containing protein [Psychrobacter sp. APC 3426]